MRQAAPVLAQSEGPKSGAQTSGEQSSGKKSVYLGGQKGEQGPVVHLAAKGGQQNLNWVNRYSQQAKGSDYPLLLRTF